MKPLLASLLVPTLLVAQQPAPGSTRLTDERIMMLAQAGVSEAELLRLVNTAAHFDFDLRPNSTEAMLKAGVSENVIRAMAGRESGAAPVILPQPSAGPAPKDDPPTPTAATRTSPPALVTTTSSELSLPQAATGSYKLAYDGGSLGNLKIGSGVRLYLEQNGIRLATNNADVISLPAPAITEISYGQDVHRRVGAAIGLALVSFGIGALMALAKSKKHYIGIIWDEGGNKGGAAFQADKNDYRGVLAGLEGITGKRAVNSEAMTVRN